MKDEVLEELKKDENCKKKIFTKRKVKGIINKDYNPFEVNYKIYQRRDGLYNMKKILLDEEMKKLSFKDKLITKIFGRTFINVYKMGIEKGFNSRM